MRERAISSVSPSSATSFYRQSCDTAELPLVVRNEGQLARETLRRDQNIERSEAATKFELSLSQRVNLKRRNPEGAGPTYATARRWRMAVPAEYRTAVMPWAVLCPKLAPTPKPRGDAAETVAFALIAHEGETNNEAKEHDLPLVRQRRG
jgi:hypothetical protein